MDDCETPRKMFDSNAAAAKQLYKKSPATFKFINHFKTQLCNSQKNLKVSICNLGALTPDKRHGEFIATPGKNCGLSSATKSYNLFPIVNTPPSDKRKKKVINPFEAALAERLHLPLICSPSLFQRPSTPQCSSSQFEWTIEEVSSMGPANVEPHETQFQDVFDPEIEAKTQAAISSFFNEQQIVPSPVDRPPRKQRGENVLIENCTSHVRSVKRIRDGVTQTMLTFPPVLPPEIEKILKPYFHFIQDQQQSPSISCDKSDSSIAFHEARDASLRRKLFAVSTLANDDTFDADYDENEIFQSSAFSSPPPKSPDIIEEIESISCKERSSNAFDKNSFGSLSPISKFSSDSPSSKKFSFEKHCIDRHEPKNISPIKSHSLRNVTIQHSKVNSTSLHQQNLSGTEIKKSYKSTPDNYNMQVKISFRENISEHDMSIDSSFNQKINRLLVNSLKQNDSKINEIPKSKLMADMDIFNQNEYDDDDMQVSQLSEKSANSSHSSNSDTPRRSKKALCRKNLSRSFSSHVSDDEDNIIVDIVGKNTNTSKQKNNIIPTLEKTEHYNANENVYLQPPEKSLFHRTDSGFNEMTSTQDDIKFINNLENNMKNNTVNNADISMISCSTPSRKVVT